MSKSNSAFAKLSLLLPWLCLLAWMPLQAAAEETSLTETFARYARHGADVWARNPSARISGEGKSCISCHTSLPYALVEPLLEDDYQAYQDMLENIDNRIVGWNDNTPWYSEDKLEQTAVHGGMPPDALKEVLDAADSRGVEAVFNAVIRASHDAYAGVPAKRETQMAFRNMWAEQVKTGEAAGRWRWIYANLLPWEVTDSDLWGASLACVAASIYPDLAPEGDLQLLHQALQQASVNADVSLHVKSGILWCDTETGGRILNDGQARKLANELLELQRDDGGWTLRDLGPWPEWEGSDADCCQKRELRSDAYATGFVTLALTRSRHLLPAEQQTKLDQSVAWIDQQLSNPYPDGPRYNRHNSGDGGLPEFRNNLYTNAGHMWAFLAKTAHQKGMAPWSGD